MFSRPWFSPTTRLKIPTRFLDELIYFSLFLSVISVNKYVLSGLKFTVPTVFQGWQTFVCVLLLSLLIKFQKIKNELQILDKKTIYLIIPLLIMYAISIVAGSKALAELPVGVFLAVTNLVPASLILLNKRNDVSACAACSSIAIFGTVITVSIFNIVTFDDFRTYLWMFGHVLLLLLQILYLKKLDVTVTKMTQIYYCNFFSVVVLLPVSIYLDVLYLPPYFDWKFYSGCLLSGILGTILQIWNIRMESKHYYVSYQGFAKLITSLLLHAYALFDDIAFPSVWFLVVVNLVMCTFFLDEDKPADETKSSNVSTIPVDDNVPEKTEVRF